MNLNTGKILLISGISKLKKQTVNTQFFGHNIIKLQTVDSTNKYAIELIPRIDPIEGAVVWAMEQEAGRGRNNNKWESEGGKNLTFSIILYPDFLNVDQQFYISKAVSLGILDFIKIYAGNASIKWPNDIYVDNKKISGVLIENTIKGNKIENCVVGIGLNVNQTVFKGNVPNPVSLKLILKNDIDLNESLEKICGSVEARYLQLQKGNLAKIDNDYLENLYRINEFHSFISNSKSFIAKIVNVLPSGNIVLEHKDGETYEYNMNELEFVI